MWELRNASISGDNMFRLKRCWKDKMHFCGARNCGSVAPALKISDSLFQEILIHPLQPCLPASPTRDQVLPSVGLSHQDLWLLSIRSSQQGNGKFDFELDYLAVLSLLALFTSLAHLSVGNLFVSNQMPGKMILIQEKSLQWPKCE